MFKEKKKSNPPQYQKQVMLLQKGERLKALILLGISPLSACYPVSTEEERAVRCAAEKCSFSFRCSGVGFLFFCVSRP